MSKQIITVIKCLEEHNIPTDIIQQICPLVVHPCAYEIPLHSSLPESFKSWLYAAPRAEHPILKHILRDWVQQDVLTAISHELDADTTLILPHSHIGQSASYHIDFKRIEYDNHPAIWFGKNP